MFSFNDKESERASEMGQLGMAVGIACNIFYIKKKNSSFYHKYLNIFYHININIDYFIFTI